MKRISASPAVVVLVAVAIGLVFASFFVGPAHLSAGQVFQILAGRGDPRLAAIVWELRLPRALLALLIGAALSGAGAAFQGLFRNPLADPYVAGVSGGAALGAVVVVVAGVQMTLVGLGAATVAAFAGSLTAAFVVYGLARVGGRVPVTTLLLAGFAVGTLASAAVSILLLVSTKNWNEIMAWLLGSLDRPDAWVRLWVALPFVALPLWAIGRRSRELNLLLLGEESAQQMGVDAERLKKVLLASGTVATAAAVAMCGLIGFVGLIVPHAVRLIVGPDHRKLLPVTVLGGASFLLAADLLSRVLLSPGGVPVGAVTAVAGAPFFLALLRRKARV